MFDRWDAPKALQEVTTVVHGIAPYQPGQFYKRELPCLLALLNETDHPITAVIVDGHTWLQAGKPGLGHHLWEALDQRIPVIGVAKRSFVDGCAQQVLRGRSKNPLWVTAVGCSVSEAVDGVRMMNGPNRIPTLFKRVDAMSRGR